MSSNVRFFGSLFIMGFMVIGFQNCGDGFTALSGESNLSQNTDDSTGAKDPSVEIVPSAFGISVVESCSDAVGLPNLVNCLESRDANTLGLTQELVNSCRINVGEELSDVVICLANNNFAPAGYREPSQIDVDQCLMNGGRDRLAVCLYNKGVLPDAIAQVQIEQCYDTAGASAVESCLRQNGSVRDNGFLFQSDVNTCEKVFGTDRIAECLKGKELIPASVSQVAVSTCIENTGGTAARVARCLRLNGQVPKFIAQPHVNRCSDLSGPGNIAACLDLNGLAEDGVGQEQIDECLTANGDDVSRIPACLRSRGLISARPIPASFELCGRLAGSAAIATCLAGNGLLLPGVTQEEINSCLMVVPMSGLTVCLESRGVLASFTQLTGSTGVVGMNCVGCHRDEVRSGGFSWMSFQDVQGLLDPATPTNADGSRIIQRMTDPNNPMPPGGMLNPADIQKMRTWIEQGAVENY